MKLLLYVGKIFLGAVALTLVGLTVLVVSASFIENAGTLTRAKAGSDVALQIALLTGITFAYQIFPAACLLGALIAGTQLARRGELLAVQAAGIATSRIAAGILFVSLVFAGIGIASGEWLVPRAMRQLATLQRDVLRRPDAVARAMDRPAQWVRRGELVLHLPAYDPQAEVFATPIVYWFREGRVLRVADAARLRYAGRSWWLEEARLLEVDSGVRSVEARVDLPLTLDVRELIQTTGDPRQLGTADILALVERREASGLEVTRHLLEVHTRAAQPLNALSMTLLALPWALHPDRRRSLAVTLGGGVVAIALFFTITYVFFLLALSHHVPLVLGAWGMLLVSTIAMAPNLWAYARYRTRGSLW